MLALATVWTPAWMLDGGVRVGGDVAELTGLLDLVRWSAGMRVIALPRRPHPGVQPPWRFEQADGYRYQGFSPTPPAAAPLSEPVTGHARVEDRIRPTPKTVACAASFPVSSPSTPPG